jgi:putative glutathione S-transferase
MLGTCSPTSRRTRSRSTRSRCGQSVYDAEVAARFGTLDELDARLAGRRFLLGPMPVETDRRLFTTLLRFDAVSRAHYYRTHPQINPSRLVTVRPSADFGAPHDRRRLTVE